MISYIYNINIISNNITNITYCYKTIYCKKNNKKTYSINIYSDF